MIVRSDCGSDNGLVAAMQSHFRAGGDDEFAGANGHNMDLHLQTRGSKGGGLLSDKVVQTGGSFSSRTCVNLE